MALLGPLPCVESQTVAKALRVQRFPMLGWCEIIPARYKWEGLENWEGLRGVVGRASEVAGMEGLRR